MKKNKRNYDNPKYFTTTEAAILLGAKSVEKVREFAKKKKIAKKIRGRYYIPAKYIIDASDRGKAIKEICKNGSVPFFGKGKEKLKADFFIDVENGIVDQSKIKNKDNVLFEAHKRGRNWIATVEKDPRSPGGIGRDFWEKVRGSWKEVPTDIKKGDIIEIAYDYISWGSFLCERR